MDPVLKGREGVGERAQGDNDRDGPLPVPVAFTLQSRASQGMNSARHYTHNRFLKNQSSD